ncbi:MAG: hypothetical protein FD174_698 [Geobacteraceae bacterium]|nr:MAG: hypothetical protein FD174_698 [Geobacteraceae bacterium]
MTPIRVLTLTALTFSLLFTGCSEKFSTQQEKEQQKSTPATADGSISQQTAHAVVMRYNQLLADGYRNLNMTPLQEVATEDLARKAYHHMAAISEGKKRMDSKLKKFEFVKTEFPQPGRCRIQTRELWDYNYSDIETGKISTEVKDYIYHVNYTLENRGGRWLITSIVANGEESGGKSVPSWDKMFEGGKTTPQKK